MIKNKFCLFCLLCFLSCENSIRFEIDPLKSIYIGMSEKEAKGLIKKYKEKNIIRINNFVTIKKIKSQVDFYFCDKMYGSKLEAITFKTNKADSLFKKISEDFTRQNKRNTSLNIDKVIVRSSLDLMVSFDTLVCIYSDSIKYLRKDFILTCN